MATETQSQAENTSMKQHDNPFTINDDIKSIDSTRCCHNFPKCPSANNIKTVLEEYNKIILDKNENVDCYILSDKMNELINNKLFSGKYSHVALMNDFFHIKYNHHTNDDPKAFNLFYKFLTDYDD
eukprot:511423_1